jgi:hypothetical protein
LPFVRVCRSRSSLRSPTCAFSEEPHRAGSAAFHTEPGRRAETMRDGGSEEGECDAGEEPEEHPDDGEDEDEEEGEVHQNDSARCNLMEKN